MTKKHLRAEYEDAAAIGNIDMKDAGDALSNGSESYQTRDMLDGLQSQRNISPHCAILQSSVS